MYLKRLLALLCSLALVFCLVPSTAFASGGNGNIDGGGGGMGQGTSSNFWNPGNDGVRITVVDAESGAAVSSPLDFSNRTQKSSILHFGKVNKLQYLSGSGLSLQSGVAYSCIKPAQSMPTIVSSKGQSNIDAIKRYFCSEYACMMVAQAAGVDYERMIAGEYKLLIEPIAYFTHNGQYYCMTATEAGLYDQMSGGNLRRTMTSLTHKNLPLAMFLEFSDLGISAWTGNTTGTQNNSDIINTLGVGIVWFDEAPPEGDIEAPDVEYRVDTDVITSVTLRTDKVILPRVIFQPPLKKGIEVFGIIFKGGQQAAEFHHIGRLYPAKVFEPCRVQIKRHPLPVEQCQDPLKGLVLFQQLQRLARIVVPVEQVRAEKRLPHHVLLCVRQCG